MDEFKGGITMGISEVKRLHREKVRQQIDMIIEELKEHEENCNFSNSGYEYSGELYPETKRYFESHGYKVEYDYEESARTNFNRRMFYRFTFEDEDDE